MLLSKNDSLDPRSESVVPGESAWFEDNATVDPPFPGTNLKVGSNSSEVARMQKYLNAVAPAIVAAYVRLTVDGIFGSETQKAVKLYQAASSLSDDGIIGIFTWNAIVTDYNTKIGGSEATYPGIPLKSGSRSSDVNYMEKQFDVLVTVYSALGKQTIDGIFGSDMAQATRLFQRQFGISVDSILGEKTWNHIVTVVIGGMTTPVITNYPGYNIQNGSSGDYVRLVQSYLNRVRKIDDFNWPHLTIDGVFGTQTQKAVEAFERNFGLSADGIVGPLTWSELLSQFNATLSA